MTKYEKIGDKEYEMRLFEDYDIHVNNLTFKEFKNIEYRRAAKVSDLDY